MDLLTSIANEFDIPFVRKDQKIWFFRTKGGTYYYDFVANNFIALGWDRIPASLIRDSQQGKEAKKAQIEQLYPLEKRPGLIFSQMDIFYNQMNTGDLVLIPDEGSKSISVGIIGKFVESIQRQSEDCNHEQCTYVHRRSVEWKKKIASCHDIYLFKALRAQQTISDVTDESSLILRNLFPVYISSGFIHFTFQKQTSANLSVASNVDLLSNIIRISDVTATLYGKESFSEELTMKTAVGSPGFLEIILPGNPIATISVGLILFAIRSFIGKEKNAEGGTTTGLLALISKINDLVNDHQNRKKIAADIRQTEANTKLSEAQTKKILAETELLQAQTAKANIEARRLELENEQIELLPSGKTTEDVRVEDEQLSIPDANAITGCVQAVDEYGCKICKAAKANGLSLGGEKIGKVG